MEYFKIECKSHMLFPIKFDVKKRDIAFRNIQSRIYRIIQKLLLLIVQIMKDIDFTCLSFES